MFLYPFPDLCIDTILTTMNSKTNRNLWQVISGNTMHLSSILSAMAKAVSTYVNVDLEKKNSKKTSFTLSLWIKIFRRIYTPLPPLSHPTMSNFLPHLHLSVQSRIHCGQAISRGLETFLQFQQGPSDNIGNTHVRENTHKHSYMLVLFMRSGTCKFVSKFHCVV